MYAPSDGPQGPSAYPSLAGRVVIMTGGGQGLGRAMALALAERGASVVVTAAREVGSLEDTEKAADGLPGRVAGLQADVREPADCARTVRFALDTFGGLHTLVNNAARGVDYVRETAGGEVLEFWKADAARWREVIEVNVIGLFEMTRAVTPVLVDQNTGHIVNLSTSDRSLVRPRGTPYGPSKAALEAATVAWAKELEPHGVTANVLLPGGAAATRMAFNSNTQRLPGQKLHPPEIMVPPILWLCADQSDGHTGGRYVAAEWDPGLPTDEAAAAARQPAHDLPAIM